MKEIIMHTIKSSQLDAAGYDTETNELYVEFSSGKIYKYEAVPKKVFDKLIGPIVSAGSFFHSDIRMKYKYEKFEPTPEEQQSNPSAINLVHQQ